MKTQPAPGRGRGADRANPTRDGAVAAARRLALARGVLAATTICPRIIREATLAAHDPDASPALRLSYVAAARRLASDLAAELHAVELWLEREASRGGNN